MPDVSVVVPTRDGAARLGRCLDAIAAQTAPPLEILVVDDGSRDPAALQAVVDRIVSARLLRREHAGPAAARNAGVREATAPLVCFTDDDCAPRPGWTSALAAAIRAGADAAAGRRLTNAPENSYSAATQLIVDHLERTAALSHSAFLDGANFGARREVLLETPFDESFPSAAGEDRDLTNRLERAGRRLVFVPNAVVVHHDALGPGPFLRQHVRYGRGAWRLWHAEAGRARLQPASFYAQLLAAGFERGPAIGSLVAVAQVATGLGAAREALAMPVRARRAARDGRESSRAPRP